MTWQEIEVAPGRKSSLDIPLDAYWVRVVFNQDAKATAMFFYE